MDTLEDNETNSVGVISPAVSSDSVRHENPVFDISDSDTEVNEVATNGTSPARSETSLKETTNPCTSPSPSDTDDGKMSSRCSSPVLSSSEVIFISASPMLRF